MVTIEDFKNVVVYINWKKEHTKFCWEDGKLVKYGGVYDDDVNKTYYFPPDDEFPIEEYDRILSLSYIGEVDLDIDLSHINDIWPEHVKRGSYADAIGKALYGRKRFHAMCRVI